MKYILVLLFSLQVQANESGKNLHSERVVFRAEPFVVNAEGSILEGVGDSWAETRWIREDELQKTMVLKANFENMPPLIVEITLKRDKLNHTSVEFIQWEKMTSSRTTSPAFSKELKRESKKIQDFGSLQFSGSPFEKRKWVVRLTPNINRDPVPEKQTILPMALSDILIVDSAGKIWGRYASATGSVVRVSGAQGSIYLSFVPFPGGQEMGSAKDTDIRLTTPDGKQIWARSAKPVIGGNYAAVVYARIEPKLKIPSGGISSMEPAQVPKDVSELSK